MNSMTQFEEPAKKILNCENLIPNLQSNQSTIDKNLLNEYQKYMLPDLEHLQFSNANTVEPTDQVDIRVKKMEELGKRLKNCMSNLKIESKDPNEQCAVHNRQSTAHLSERFLDSFLAKEFVRTVIEEDAGVFDQHISNITKIKKFCDFTLISELTEEQGDNTILPGLQAANEVTTLLSEMDTDIDTLTDAMTLYSGLPKETLINPFEEEIKELKNLC